MSKAKLMMGLLIISAIFFSGCSGTKTMAGDGQAMPAGQAAALNDYTKCARELADEISFLKNHYPLSPNATLDQYQEWLNGFNEKLALSRQMYNNTSAASNKYLSYLNNSSDEYRNVTNADAAYVNDIEQLNRTYWNHSEYLNMYIKKMAALEKYKEKLNRTLDAYNDMTGFAGNAKIDSIESYSSFIDTFGSKANAYKACAEAALEAGEEYGNYCEPGTEEYKALQENNNALKEGIEKCQETYENYRKDYTSKAGLKDTIQNTFNDYGDKVGKAAALKGEVDKYRTTEIGPSKLDRSWLDGYKQKIDAYSAACNDAIASGNACKQYLDPAGSDYASIQDNEKKMKDSLAEYNENYNSLNARYKNLHPLGSLT